MHESLLIIKAALLGIVEGLTEFLPVSSTGHLILADDLMSFAESPGKLFDIVIQAGAILAICILYAKKFYFVATHITTDRESRKFVYNIGLAFLPAAILGVLLHKVIKEYLFSPYIVAISLIVGGIIIIIAERIKVQAKYFSVEKIPYRKVLLVGFFQCLAMIPGVSRSGSTIISARLLGTTRRVATEFSFFLAVPTLAGATVYDLYKNIHDLKGDTPFLIIVGFTTAFVTGILVVNSFMKYIKKHDFSIFGWYRIVAGILMLFYYIRVN